MFAINGITHTNASDAEVAQALGYLTKIDQGTLFAARVHKMGQQRGPKSKRVVYGDDEVAVVIWTGFSYRALIERSSRMLEHQLQQGRYIERLAKATLEEHGSTSIADVCHALQETRDWFRRVLTDPSVHVPSEAREKSPYWEPLEVNGEKVRGARVYTGPKSDDPRKPVPGSVYVTGVKLGEKVVTPAANGPWRPDSKPKTVAKQVIKDDLPVGLFCQYRLDPERAHDICVGKQAAGYAKASGIYIDPDALRSLFKIA